MIWNFIKAGTNGDRYAQPVMDEKIKTEEVAAFRAKSVLYENNRKIKVKVLYPEVYNFEVGDVVFFESQNKFYQIKSISYSELPYVIIEMTEVV